MQKNCRLSCQFCNNKKQNDVKTIRRPKFRVASTDFKQIQVGEKNSMENSDDESYSNHQAIGQNYIEESSLKNYFDENDSDQSFSEEIEENNSMEDYYDENDSDQRDGEEIEENSSMENYFDENDSDQSDEEHKHIEERQEKSDENSEKNDEVICEDKSRNCAKWANENRCHEKGKGICNSLPQVIHDRYSIDI